MRTNRNNHVSLPSYHRIDKLVNLPKSDKNPLKNILLILFILSFSVLLFTTLFEIKSVNGESMEPSYRNGSHVVVFRWAFGPLLPILNKYLFFWKTPAVGEVVTFYHPVHLKESMKMVAIPGGEKILLSRNGLEWSFGPTPILDYQRQGLQGLKTVPEGRVFLVGINDSRSTDSRDYGTVPIAFLTGLVLFSF